MGLASDTEMTLGRLKKRGMKFNVITFTLFIVKYHASLDIIVHSLPNLQAWYGPRDRGAEGKTPVRVQEEAHSPYAFFSSAFLSSLDKNLYVDESSAVILLPLPF